MQWSKNRTILRATRCFWDIMTALKNATWLGLRAYLLFFLSLLLFYANFFLRNLFCLLILLVLMFRISSPSIRFLWLILELLLLMVQLKLFYSICALIQNYLVSSGQNNTFAKIFLLQFQFGPLFYFETMDQGLNLFLGSNGRLY